MCCYKRSGKIKTPDATLAATAIVYGFTLITSDLGFATIQSLEVINPLDL